MTSDIVIYIRTKQLEENVFNTVENPQLDCVTAFDR